MPLRHADLNTWSSFKNKKYVSNIPGEDFMQCIAVI